MNVGELRDALKDIPDDVPVRMNVVVQQGFYDVRAKTKTAGVYSIHYNPGQKHLTLTD